MRLICCLRGHGYVHIPTLRYRPHTRWCGQRPTTTDTSPSDGAREDGRHG